LREAGDTSIAIAGGRTGGHLFPAIAVAESLKRMKQQLRLYMIGTSDGMEATIAPKAGLEFHSVSAIPLRRSLTLRNLAIPLVLARGVLQSMRLLKKKKTSAVFATGGFVCVPVLMAARIRRIRFYLQEQNSYPGLTTRLFARKAEAVFAAYKDVGDYLHPDSNVIATGNPLRTAFKVARREEGISYFDLDSDMKTLLIFGGSQGAEAINNYVAANLGRIKDAGDIQLVWQTGTANCDKYKRLLESSGVDGNVQPFIDRMDLAYASADLVISRAGAMTLAELAATGKPAILIPYPFAAENHQEYNADLVARKGAAWMILQKDIEESDLLGKAIDLIKDDNLLSSLAEKAGRLHSAGAADAIASKMLEGIS